MYKCNSGIVNLLKLQYGKQASASHKKKTCANPKKTELNMYKIDALNEPKSMVLVKLSIYDIYQIHSNKITLSSKMLKNC